MPPWNWLGWIASDWPWLPEEAWQAVRGIRPGLPTMPPWGFTGDWQT